MLRNFLRSKIIVFVFLGVLVGGMLIFFIFRDHTTYSPGFSHERFALITPGLSEDVVNTLLGPPLGIDVGPFRATWYYSSPWLMLRTNELIIIFEPDGKVADTMGDARAVANSEIRPGDSIEDVLRKVDMPSQIDPPYHKKAWYSRQKNNAGKYSIFAVLYDERGIVVKTEATWDFD